MARWFRFYNETLDDPKVQRLPPVAFKRALIDAMAGKQTPFSRHIRPGSDRPSAEVWMKLRTAVFSRDDYTCTYCGERGKRLECDHVVPVSKGGSNDLGNLATACLPCNRSKRDKTLTEWRGAA